MKDEYINTKRLKEMNERMMKIKTLMIPIWNAVRVLPNIKKKMDKLGSMEIKMDEILNKVTSIEAKRDSL